MATLTKPILTWKDRSNTHNAYIAIVIGLMGASFAAVLMRLSLDAGVPAVFVATARLALASLFLTPFVLRFYGDDLKKLSRRDVVLSALAGLWLAGHFMLIATAFDHTTILVGQIIINTGPLWVALIEVVFLKVRLSRLVWVGMFLAIIGGLIIGIGSATQSPAAAESSSTTSTSVIIEETSATPTVTSTQADADKNPVLGSVLALIGAVAGAIYLTVSRAARASISIIPYVWIMYGFGAVGGLVVMAFTQTSILGYSNEAYMWLVLLTIGPQLVGHSGLNYAVGYLSATIVSVSTQSIAISAAIIAFFLFHEIPTSIELLGSLVIGIGVLVSIFNRGGKKAAKSPPKNP